MRRTGFLLMALVLAVAVVPAIVQAKDVDWTKMDEDVLIMERLVEETIARVGGIGADERLRIARSMGIAAEESLVVFNVGEMPSFDVRLRSDITALYLPGYGALLMGRLGVPLAPAAEPEAEEAPKESTRWADARRKILGLSERPGRTVEPKTYDEELVRKIQEAFAELLSREAQNFTELAEGERVTVFLYGPVAGAEAEAATYEAAVPLLATRTNLARQRGGSEMTRVVLGSATSSVRSVLMISVKAADLAAKRQGKLSANDVRKRIEISQR